MPETTVVGVLGPIEDANILLSNTCGATLLNGSGLSHTLPTDLAGQYQSYYDANHATLYLHSQISSPHGQRATAGTDEDVLKGSPAEIKRRQEWQETEAQQLKQALVVFLTCNLVVWCYEGPDLESLSKHLITLQKAKAAWRPASKDATAATKLLSRAQQGSKQAGPGLILALGNPAWRTSKERHARDRDAVMGVLAAVSKLGDRNKLFSHSTNDVFLVPPSRDYFMAGLDAALTDLDSPIRAFPEQEPYAILRSRLTANSGAPPAQTPFPPKEWSTAFSQLASTLIDGRDGTLIHGTDAAGVIAQDCQTLVRASQELCLVAYAKAMEEYRKRAPKRYTEVQHQEILKHAARIYLAQARGPGTSSGMRKLEEDCTSHWQERQGCDAVSLTGNQCIHPPHKIPNKTDGSDPDLGKVEADSARPSDPADEVCQHSSGKVFKLVDATGMSVTQMEDPFTIRHAITARLKDITANISVQSMQITLAEDEREVNDEDVYVLEDCVAMCTHSSSRQKELLPLCEEGKDKLHSMCLPNQRKEPEVQETSSKDSEGEASSLDLEFPALMAVVSRTQQKKASDGSDQKKQEARRDEEYREEVRSGWPGLSWTQKPKQIRAVIRQADTGKRGSRRLRQPGSGASRRDTRKEEASVGPDDSSLFYAGFEYETSSGKRIILDLDQLSPGGSSVNSDAPEVAQMLLRDLPLFMPIKQKPLNPSEQSIEEAAQLMRIWIQPPEGPVKFACKPSIEFQEGQRVIKYELASALEIPNGHLSCISLPFAYACPKTFLSPEEHSDFAEKNVGAPGTIDWTLLAGVIFPRRLEGKLNAISIMPM